MRLEVDVEPLREAFLASGLSANEVARRLGWLRADRARRNWKPDCTRVRRALGLKTYRGGAGTLGCCRRTTYERGLAFAEAIGVDPVDVGL